VRQCVSASVNLVAHRSLVGGRTRGDPESPLRWTCKSTRTLAQELTGRQHPISHEKVAQLLRDMDYSLQGNARPKRGRIIPTEMHSSGT
jgi:hypothetical protein